MKPTMQSILKALIQAKIKTAFIPEYQSKATDAQALGLILASYFEFDGLELLKVAYFALEDANFHEENKTIQTMIDKLEGKVSS